MAAPWYDAANEPSAEAAWELYQANAKRSRGERPATARPAGAATDYGGFPALALEAVQLGASQQPGALPFRTAPIPLRRFSDLLALGCRGIAGDPVGAFVFLLSVETLPRGLAWYDAAAHRLRLLRRDGVGPDLERALVAPEVTRRAGALIVLAADFDAATAASGERGYREALLLAGRRLAALRASAEAAGLGIDEAVGFYDRELDALLFLDGLARSAVAAVAVG
jgi:hypothetical protein